MQQKSNNIVVLILFSLVFIFGCKKEFDFPVLFTGFATDIIPEEGAVLNGRIVEQGSLKIDDHGFLWKLKSSHRPSPTIFNSEIISLGEPDSEIFSAHLSTELPVDRYVYFRTFAKGDDHIIYGPIRRFFSKGGPTKKLHGFYPHTAGFRDTITLIGENFTGIADDYTVRFNQSSASIVEVTSDEILVLVPRTLNNHEAEISLHSESGHVFFADTLFKLLPPEITSFSPETINRQTLLSIHGTNFHENSLQNTVYIGDQKADLEQSAINQLDVYANYFTPGGGTYPVEVHTLGQTSQGGMYIQAQEPWDTLNLPTLQNLQNTYSFAMTIGDRVFAGKKGQFYEYLPETDSWEIRAPFWETNPFDIRVHTSSSNFGFILVSREHNYSWEKYLWRYRPVTNDWQELAEFPGVNRSHMAAFTLGQNIYIGLGYGNGNDHTRNFWNYNIDSGNWTQLADFPMEGSVHATGFTFQGQGYFLLHSPNQNQWKIVRYHQQTDSWELITDFADVPAASHRLVWPMDDKLVILSKIGNYELQVLELSLSSRFLEIIDMIPVNNSEIYFSFTRDNMGYLWTWGNYSAFPAYRRHFWRYDPSMQGPMGR